MWQATPVLQSATVKVSMAECQDLPQQRWRIRDEAIVLDNTTQCMEVWHNLTRWPWWVSTSPCNGLAQQAWHVDNNTISAHKLTHGCWPGAGGAPGASASCCLMAEGGNPEIDQCGWMTNLSRQAWQRVPSTVVPEATLLRSAASGACLTQNAGLEIYAGPLAGGNQTAVLLNRSPVEAVITLEFKALAVPNWGDDTTLLLRDILAHKDLGLYRGSFAAMVPSHGIVHINLYSPS